MSTDGASRRTGLGDSSGSKRCRRLRLRCGRSPCRYIRISWSIFAAPCVADARSARVAASYRERCGFSFECVEQRERTSFSFNRNGFFPVEKKLGQSVENGGGSGSCCRELLQFARGSRAQSSADADSASSIVALNATAAEHWIYLPSAFFFLAIALEIVELGQKLKSRRSTIAATTLVLGVVWMAFLGARTFARTFDWKDQPTFLERTIAHGGDSARMLINLGGLELTEGKLEDD